MDSTAQTTAALAAGRTICQLQCAPGAVTQLAPHEHFMMRLDKAVRRGVLRAKKMVTDPGVVLRKVRTTPAAASAASASTPTAIPRRHSPPLAPGDRVRVRSRAEIDATLDAAGACDGMTFLDVVMERYCGQTFTVRRRIDRFFDERNWKMLKLRDAVILDGAFCEPPKSAGVDWAGCDRSCFLFWKEAWLERVAANEANAR